MPELASPDAWPQRVLEAPLLRGLDARALREIAGAGELVRLRPGERLYAEGEPGDAFFVVASGRVALRAVRRGEAVETELRAVEEGGSFGEEATVGATRRATAAAEGKAVVARIPVHVFRRAAARSGKATVAEKLERTLRRAATRELFAALALAQDLAEEDMDLLLDAATHRRLERGEAAYRQGDLAAAMFLVADGMVQIQRETEGRIHVRAYLGRGDFFGDAERDVRTPRAESAVASGPCLLVAIPAGAVAKLEARHPDLLRGLRRLDEGRQDHQGAVIGRAAKNATQHLFRDLYKLDVARSLLVIDLDACARCGHCAWACADVHADGVARIVRRGDKVETLAQPSAPPSAPSIFVDMPSNLLLPSSCQHCENPACMQGCPTGAIGRDPEGDVFIREELCTGCGACARACPWDNVQMAPRTAAAPRPQGGVFPDVAVKCDLCRGLAGPACVASCPTEAIRRVQPSEDLVEVRALLGSRARSASAAEAPAAALRAALGGPALAGASLAAVGAVMHARGAWRPGAGGPLALGIAAAVGFALLLAYALPKRMPRRFIGRRAGRGHPNAPGPARASRSRLRPHLAAHLALGVLTLGLALAHAPWPRSGQASLGAATLAAMLLTAVLGGATALAYRLVPRRLTRLERTAALPEDLAGARRELHERLFAQATGKSDLVKKLLQKILLPYAHSALGPLFLLASGRTLREEERRLRAEIDRKLEGRGAERLAGLDELLRTVVELRALPAQRGLLTTLRAGLPLHIITFALAAALLVLHAATATGYGR